MIDRRLPDKNTPGQAPYKGRASECRTSEGRAGVLLLPPSISLVEEVADRLISHGPDYSSNLVVFPGKRPAHFLRKTLAQRQVSSYVPPVILSMDEFIDRTYETMNASGLRKLETIDAVAFLFRIHHDMAAPLGGKEFMSAEAFFSLGLRIFRDIEELLIEAVEPARLRDVEHYVDSPIPPHTNAGLQSLSFFYEKFYGAIEKAGFSSRSQRYCAVCSAITGEMLPYKTIVFAGFHTLTRSEKTLFKRILSWENAFFLFQDGPGMRECMASLGIERLSGPDGTSGGVDDNGPDVRFYKSPDSHGQVFALSGLLRDRMQAGEDGGEREGTVIVLPSPETLFPLLYHALPLVPDSDYNISLGYPLERTPTWGFLNNLMQLIMSMDGERLYVPDYLRFVLHPYTKNIYMKGKAETTRLLFHTVEELLLEDRTRSFIGLDEIEGDGELYRKVRARASGTEGRPDEREIAGHLRAIHDELIRKCSAFHDVKDFAGKMIDVLSFIYEHSSARLHPFFHPFAESFIRYLDALGKSLVGELSFDERNSYFHFLKAYVSHCFTPFEGTPLKGVQVLGFLETRNLRFDRVYILDANEDVIPDTTREDSLLPLRIRRLLGLSTYRDRDMLSAYYFDTLVRGSRETHLFFTESPRAERSRFVERLLWKKEKKDGVTKGAGLIRSVGYNVSLENKEPAPVEKSASVVDFLGSRTYDATSLDVYLRCPLKFYYRYVLNLKSKQEAGPATDRADIGKFVHKVLFRYFEKRKGIQLTEKAMDLNEMAFLVDSLFEEAYGADPIGRAYLLKRQVRRQMVAFLQHFQIPLVRRTPVSILHLEQPLQASIESFRLKGIADRIEMRGGRLCIVDYKTGSSTTRLSIDFEKLDVEDRCTWSRTVGTLQLPFYLLLLEGAGRNIEDMDAFFLLLGRGHLDEKIELGLFRDGDDRGTCYRRAKEVIVRLIREIADPSVPFAAVYRAKNACTWCDYPYMCGMQWQG